MVRSIAILPHANRKPRVKRFAVLPGMFHGKLIQLYNGSFRATAPINTHQRSRKYFLRSNSQFSFPNIESSPAQRPHTLTNPHRFLNISCHCPASTHVLPHSGELGLNKAMLAVFFSASQLSLHASRDESPLHPLDIVRCI